MKSRLLDYLACPVCGGVFTIGGAAGRAVESGIVEGTLQCDGCSRAYPVVRSVPRLPLAGEHGLAAITERTRRTYTFTWRRFGEPAVAAAWEKDSYRYSELIPAELTSGAGRVGLDTGCGAGHDLMRVADGGAEIIGFDLSDGVEVAQRLTAYRPNVHIVQGDLNRLPFRPGIFAGAGGIPSVSAVVAVPVDTGSRGRRRRHRVPDAEGGAGPQEDVATDPKLVTMVARPRTHHNVPHAAAAALRAQASVRREPHRRRRVRLNQHTGRIS